MLFKGFRFGMVLQFAIGPVCLFVLLCSRSGFFYAERAVISVTLVDSLYILLAILGITSFLNNEKLKKTFMFIGAAVIMLFGLSTILGVLNIEVIPAFNIADSKYSNSPFIYGFLLTAANPLTILFWAGIFTTKAIEEKLEKKDLYFFGAGAAASTLVFSSFVALIGSLLISNIPGIFVKALNLLVGFVLIYFAIKLLMKTKQDMG